MKIVDPVPTPADIIELLAKYQGNDALAYHVDRVNIEFNNHNQYEVGDKVRFTWPRHAYFDYVGVVTGIIKMYGGAQDWITFEVDGISTYVAAMYQVELIV